MNFVKQAIANGFKPTISRFNPDNNWFGVSKQDPDVLLVRGNKVIHLSLQGGQMPTPDPLPDGFTNVAEKMGLCYLGFLEDGEFVYQNWFGKLPDENFINKFIG